MILHRFDDAQGSPGFRGGLAMAHPEILLLSRVLQSRGTDTVFVDIGANVGNFSIALARVVGPRGQVHSFEPQRIIFNMLAGSVALNCLLNVHCHNLALGDHEGQVEIPQYDYRAVPSGAVRRVPQGRQGGLAHLSRRVGLPRGRCRWRQLPGDSQGTRGQPAIC